MLRNLVLILLIMLSQGAHAGPIFGDVILSLQKQGLQDFVVKASKYQDVADMLDKSYLQWHKGFSEMRENTRGIKIPQALVSKDGIEFNSEGKKYSIVATSKLYAFLINGKEFDMDPTLGLNTVTIDLEKFLVEPKNSMLSLFPEAHALSPIVAVPLLAGLFTEVGLTVAGVAAGCATAIQEGRVMSCVDDAKEKGLEYSLILPKFLLHFASPSITNIESYLRSSSIVCPEFFASGSFQIESMEGVKLGKPLIFYDSRSGELTVQGKKYSLDKMVEDAKAAGYRKKRDADFNDYLEKSKKTIEEEIKELSEECKRNPGQRYTWSKTSLEKSIEGLHGTLRPKNESTR